MYRSEFCSCQNSDNYHLLMYFDMFYILAILAPATLRNVKKRVVKEVISLYGKGKWSKAQIRGES